ncbi:MAG TPA: Ig-like domain-containing protein [Candidatus Acidoferrum sp.]|nr:Ig-like domain-containing protein [Candidatus Acidoferrum sp.]
MKTIPVHYTPIARRREPWLDSYARSILAALWLSLPLAGLAGPIQPPAVLDIQSSGGLVTLTWPGSGSYLESAYEITGPWFPVPGATSPYTTAASEARQFFRLNYGALNTNNLPVAVNDAYSVLHDRTLSVSAPGVLANDYDPLSRPLTSLMASDPLLGSVSLSPDGSFSYTPPPYFVGVDYFRYVDTDGVNVSTPATVLITVTDHPPVSSSDAYSVQPGQTLTIGAPGVLANDSDPDGDAIRAVTPQVSGPANGILVLNWDGSFSYTPNPGFTGTDSFVYEATDLVTNGNQATVTLNVHALNAPPAAHAGVYAIAHDQNLAVPAPGVLSSASDPDGDSLSAQLVSGTTNGTVKLFADGSFSYVPSPGFVGVDSFVYVANDGLADSAAAMITLNVTNTAPIAAPDAFATHPGQTLTVPAAGVLLNDTDAENDPLTAVLVSSPATGATLVLNTNGGFVYTPPAGFVGVDTFTYSAFDGYATSGPTLVTITVSNQPPVAVNDSYGVHMNVPLAVPAPGVLLNDFDPDGDALTARTVISPPINGTVALQPDGSFTYQPGFNYVGPDSFTYVANDGLTDSPPATVSLMVHSGNMPPVAAGQGYVIFPNSAALPEPPLVVDVPDGLLANASDADNDALTAVLVSPPAHAAAFTLYTNGTFSYLPSPGFTGLDTFTFEAFDGVAYSSPAAANIMVAYDVSTVGRSTYTLHANTRLVEPAPGLLYEVGFLDTSPIAVTAALTSPAVHGTVSLQPDGGFIYQPPTNYVGQDSFQYQVNDGISNLPPTTVVITITDNAPLASPDTYYVAPGGALSISAPGVLADDYDADSDPLTALLVAPPAHASAFTLNPDGSFIYVPQTAFSGTDAFAYQASDGILVSAPVTVEIVVSAAPVAVDDVYVYTPGVPLVIGSTNGVLQDDFDPSGGGLTAQLLTGSPLVALNPDGSFLFLSPSGPPSGSPITFQYRALLTNGLPSLPAVVTLLAAGPPAAPAPPKLALQEVTFSGGTDVLPDNSGAFNKPFAAPHWKDDNGDGIIDTTKGEHAYPYSYVQGKKAKIAAKFMVNDPALAKLKTIKVIGALFSKDTSNPLLMGVTADARMDGGGFVIDATETLGSFDPEVAKLAPLLIVWEYSTDKGAHYYPCGSSRNTVYITLGAPQSPTRTMFQTALEIGCGKGAGATKQAQILAQDKAVWKYFVTRQVQRLSDATDLTYYNDWSTRNCVLYKLLQTSDGQCMTWAELLTAVFRAQGMDNTQATIKGIRRKDSASKGFLVNTWTPKAGATTPYYDTTTATITIGADTFFQPRKPGAGKGEYLWDVVEEFKYTSAASQNNTTPAQPGPAADFNCHFVVKVVNGSTTACYDPSYGNVYAGASDADAANDAEKKAVAGYYRVLSSGGKLTYSISPFKPAAPAQNLEFYNIGASF